MPYGHSHRRGSKVSYFIGKVSAYFCPSRSHGCGEIEHLQPFGVDLDVFYKMFDMVDSFLGICISFQEMTLPLQSASHKYTVHSSFKGPQEIGLVQFACAG